MGHPPVEDFVILPMCDFFGNMGMALTGFGMAIIYLFVWQVSVLLGYESDLKYAIFIQALALLSAQITGDRVSTRVVESVGGVLVTLLAAFELYQKRYCLLCGMLGKKSSKATEETEVESSNPEGTEQQDIAGEVDAIKEAEDDAKDEVQISTKSLYSSVDKSNDASADNSNAWSWWPKLLFPPKEDATTAENEGPSLDDNGESICLDEDGEEEKGAASRDHGNEVNESDKDEDLVEERNVTGQDPSVSTDEDTDDVPLTPWARFYTLLAGAASGFLGGLCGIRGPPVILYFLYPPIVFNKHAQRATAICMSSTNVAMRVAYYLVDVLVRKRENYFARSDWGLYLAICFCSLWGGFVGTELFVYTKGSRELIRTVLAVFLLMCGVSLLLSSFTKL